jgi:hypothetical protein
VRVVCRADHLRVSDRAKAVAGVVVALITINVLLRVVSLPDVDLQSISFPDIPDWFRALLKVKNWIVGAIVFAAAVCAAVRRR